MAQTFELRVKLEEIGETEEIGNNGFKKRELIGLLEGEYPEHYKFEFIKDKVEKLDDLIPGTYATVFFNIKGRKVEKDGDAFYYTSLQGWKVEIKQ